MSPRTAMKAYAAAILSTCIVVRDVATARGRRPSVWRAGFRALTPSRAIHPPSPSRPGRAGRVERPAGAVYGTRRGSGAGPRRSGSGNSGSERVKKQDIVDRVAGEVPVTELAAETAVNRDEATTADKGLWSWRNLANAATVIGVLLAFVAAAAAWYQAWSTSEQVVVLQRQTLVSQYTASVEMLGNAEKSVRIGAIHALGLLAREEPERFHIQTMQLLSAFIREPAPAEARANELRADVQAALDIIIYRSKVGLKLEEEHRRKHVNGGSGKAKSHPLPVIDLQGSDLQWAHLYQADLTHVVLNGANLSSAHGHDAVFTGAFLLSVNARQTDLPSSNFDGAKMIGADLSHSNFRNSSFVRTEMPWQMMGTSLGESDLSGSVFGGTDLTGASLNNADLSGASFQPAAPGSRVLNPAMRRDRSNARCPLLTQAQLDSAIANPANPPVLSSQSTQTGSCPKLAWKTDHRGRAWTAHQHSAKNR